MVLREGTRNGLNPGWTALTSYAKAVLARMVLPVNARRYPGTQTDLLEHPSPGVGARAPGTSCWVTSPSLACDVSTLSLQELSAHGQENREDDHVLSKNREFS